MALKSFDVLTLRDATWAIEATAPNEDAARLTAEKLLGSRRVEGVRVARDVGRDPTQLRPEDILFEKMRPVARVGDTILVPEIDESEDCEELEDLYGVRGRATMARLFRQYLDQQGMTTLEIMHDYAELQRALNADTMVTTGIDRVAKLQTKGKDPEDLDARRKALEAMLEDVTERASTASEMRLPGFIEMGPDEAALRIVDSHAPEHADFALRVALTRDLVQTRDLWGKFSLTMQLAEPANENKALGTIDGFVADTLTSTGVIQDVLGHQEDLFHALGTLIDLTRGDMFGNGADGSLPPDHPRYAPVTLNGLMARSAMPDTESVLMQRVRRQLQSTAKLTKSGEDGEKEAFKGLLGKIVDGTKVLGGADMAAAITERQSHIINKGGTAGLEEAASTVLPTLDDPARKAGYLLSLMESELGRDTLSRAVRSMLETVLTQPRSVQQLVKKNLPPNRMMEKVTSIFYRLQQSGLAESERDRFTKRLDDLLERYIVDGKILEKIDNPDRPLHVRAFLLVDMCRPEMLPHGKASAIARQIIVKSLRRPDFETELVSQIADPKEQEQVLRKFHQRLHHCGFFG